MNFPLLLNHPGAHSVFQDIAAHLPGGCEVYIIGGAIRNALYHHYFGERLRQRDYDQIATKHSQEYLHYLRSKGFTEGSTVREDQIILCKTLVAEADPTGYDDTVVFDIHPVEGTMAIDNLQHHAGLTINGFALSLRDIFALDWIDRIIELPGAKNDLRSKQLRINQSGYQAEPANFFAVLRFMSAGFAPPPRDEVKLLLDELPRLETERFGRNVDKLYNYVGGEEEARRLVALLSIDGDVFDEGAVKGGKVKV